MEWRTIESAPQDGTPVWLISMDAHTPRVILCRYSSHTWRVLERGRAIFPNPTHWMEVETPTNLPIIPVMHV